MTSHTHRWRHPSGSALQRKTPPPPQTTPRPVRLFTRLSLTARAGFAGPAAEGAQRPPSPRGGVATPLTCQGGGPQEAEQRQRPHARLGSARLGSAARRYLKGGAGVEETGGGRRREPASLRAPGGSTARRRPVPSSPPLLYPPAAPPPAAEAPRPRRPPPPARPPRLASTGEVSPRLGKPSSFSLPLQLSHLPLLPCARYSQYSLTSRRPATPSERRKAGAGSPCPFFRLRGCGTIPRSFPPSEDAEPLPTGRRCGNPSLWNSSHKRSLLHFQTHFRSKPLQVLQQLFFMQGFCPFHSNHCVCVCPRPAHSKPRTRERRKSSPFLCHLVNE